MLNFQFHNPVKIIFGKDAISKIGQEIPAGSRILITYGGGSIKHNGVLDQVLAALKEFEVHQFGGIEANPTFETLMQAVAQVKTQNIDFLLAVGGGSVIDGTKFIAAAALFDGDPWTIMEQWGAPIKQALPLGAVLTLAATGSEMNSGGVITRREWKVKRPFSHPLVFPKFAALDPATTLSLPPRQVSNGIVDSFVHITEQYLTYPVGGKVQDRLAEGLLLTLIEEGPKALTQPDDVDVRADLMWTSTLALNGLIGAGVPGDWSTHMIGHEITAAYGLDHAQTLAIVLPALLTVKKQDKREKLLQYAERVWGLREGSEEERIDRAIAATRSFFESLQVKTRLADYGIGAESVDHLVAQLIKNGMVKLGERRDVTPEVSRQVLQLCF
ncbi:MAG: iron-containing alcohol dehydrogenase [Proteobacteria bacterium]|nr:iron-containing alcohol dehydrogenase [Pseudomonadota bacterium]